MKRIPLKTLLDKIEIDDVITKKRKFIVLMVSV